MYWEYLLHNSNADLPIDPETGEPVDAEPPNEVRVASE